MPTLPLTIFSIEIQPQNRYIAVAINGDTAMNSPTKLEKEVRRTLDILYKHFVTFGKPDPESKKVNAPIFLNSFDYEEKDGGISHITFHETVLFLSKKENFEITAEDQDWVLSRSLERGAENTEAFWVVLPANFEDVYQRLCDEYGTRHSEASTGESIVLYLNHVGDLWRNPKEQYCYAMGKDSERYKLVRYLSGNADYENTSSIAHALNKNNQTLRGEIGKINKLFTDHLGVTTILIESRKDNGYRINPKYTIKVEPT